MKNNWLNNKTVIVTGASSGIGRGITLKLIREYNCRVLGIARSEEKMKSLTNELGPDSENFSYLLFDVSKRENWKSFAEYIREKGIKPDILINNAGILPEFKKAESCSCEETERTMNINFYGAVYSMKELLPIILDSPSPAVVNIDSSAALMPLAGTSVYSASKAAQTNMVHSLSLQLAKDGITVNNVAPGVIYTDRNIEALSDAEYAKKVTDSIPVGFYGKPEDCEGIVSLLCSEEGRYITGQSIYVDGGKSVQ